MEKQEIITLIKDQILDAESFGIDEHNPHEAVHLSINQSKKLLEIVNSLTSPNQEPKVSVLICNNCKEMWLAPKEKCDCGCTTLTETHKDNFIYAKNLNQEAKVSAEDFESNLIDFYVDGAETVLDVVNGSKLDVNLLPYLQDKALEYIRNNKSMHTYASQVNAEELKKDFKYFFDCGRNYQNNAEITFTLSYQEYLNNKEK